MADKKRTEGVLSLPGKKGDTPKPKPAPDDGREKFPIRREVLWELEGFVSFEIAANAMYIDSEHVGRPYLQVMKGVNGGNVSVFIYGGKALQRRVGTTVVAQLVVKKAVYRTRNDKVYIDLTVAPRKKATHKLEFIRDRSKGQEPDIPADYFCEVGGGGFAITELPLD